jgi:hypothetical protein
VGYLHVADRLSTDEDNDRGGAIREVAPDL